MFKQNIILSENLIYFLIFKVNFFVISISHGWGVFPIHKKYTYLIFKNYFWSFYYYYLTYLKIIGRGYKIYSLLNNTLLFKLGYSHRILFNIPCNIKLILFNKSNFYIITKNLFFLKNIVFCLKKLKKINIYKVKGLAFFGECFKIKTLNK